VSGLATNARIPAGVSIVESVRMIENHFLRHHAPVDGDTMNPSTMPSVPEVFAPSQPRPAGIEKSSLTASRVPARPPFKYSSSIDLLRPRHRRHETLVSARNPGIERVVQNPSLGKA